MWQKHGQEGSNIGKSVRSELVFVRCCLPIILIPCPESHPFPLFFYGLSAARKFNTQTEEERKKERKTENTKHRYTSCLHDRQCSTFLFHHFSSLAEAHDSTITCLGVASKHLWALSGLGNGRNGINIHTK